MPHIVTMRAHPNDPDLLLLGTPPELAHTMGGFQPARYVGQAPPVPGTSYVITTDDLQRLQLFLTHHGVRLVDVRTSPTLPPLGRGTPLPECSHCGQPAQRGAHLEHCPSCGAPWFPIEVGSPYPRR